MTGCSCSVCSHPQLCLSVLGAGWSCLGSGFQVQETAFILLVVIYPATAPAGIHIAGPSTSLPGEELQAGEPGFVLRPLLHSPATSPAGSPRPSSDLSVPSPSFLSPEESLNLCGSFFSTLFREPSTYISCQGAERASGLPRGETRAPRPFSLQARGPGGDWCSRPLWLINFFNWV